MNSRTLSKPCLLAHRFHSSGSFKEIINRYNNKSHDTRKPAVGVTEKEAHSIAWPSSPFKSDSNIHSSRSSLLNPSKDHTFRQQRDEQHRSMRDTHQSSQYSNIQSSSFGGGHTDGHPFIPNREIRLLQDWKTLADKTSINNKMQAKKSKENIFANDDPNNKYQKHFTDFVIKEGFVEERDLKEMYDFLYDSYLIQFDPDDMDGNRLPTYHPGKGYFNRLDVNSDGLLIENYKEIKDKETNDYMEKRALYYGQSFKKEKYEFKHFNKSFILDSCPPFADRQKWMSYREEDNETGLYLPHVTQHIPQWTLRKKIAKTYGPHYINYITMPSMSVLPNEKDFQSMLKQFKNEQKWKLMAVENIEQIDKNLEIETKEMKGNKHILDKYLDRNISDLVKKGNTDMLLGCGSPFSNKKTDIILRDCEIWDVDICYELKTNGDPLIPESFKNEIFRQYVTSIDKNSSMSSWQKNYAFSLLPKAFGGVHGEYLDAILSRMKPREEKIDYQLEKSQQESENDDQSNVANIMKIKKRLKYELKGGDCGSKTAIDQKQEEIDFSGLGL